MPAISRPLATRIVAAPTTVTGSIGVLAGKPVLEGMYEKYGLSAQQIRRGKYALLFNPVKPWDEDGRDLIHQHTSEVYERFLMRVAEGRKKTRDEVHAIGRGGHATQVQHRGDRKPAPSFAGELHFHVQACRPWSPVAFHGAACRLRFRTGCR